MSRLPDNRAAHTASTACITMNTVTPRARANPVNRAANSASTENPWVAPAFDATSGRGRSAGNSICSGTPASRSTQYDTCRAASEPGSSTEPKISRCHTA
ncbi:hypothetical protein NRB56_76780 [Nocardia sp. RB56]|uniref:Uncharacterized protein n=1 Tax=Nocardia aurantia TaxID=2585199 RepID=A0A7K0E2E5_9NOCA|nr:hypothetical protein [Nocardia aurantia]